MVKAGRDPWKVIVYNILVQRARNVHQNDIQRIFEELLRRWPTPEALAVSDVDLEQLLEPLGLYRIRARQLQRMSLKYHSGAYSDVRDLPGCSQYVCDAVSLYCNQQVPLCSE